MDKYELVKEKGYTYDPETGKVYGVKGNEIKRKTKDGYIHISIKKDGIRTNLGYYETQEEAHKVYLENKSKLHIYG